MKHIVPPEDIEVRAAEEGLRVWVCSHGGCATNMLADYLDKRMRGSGVKTPLWYELLCHAGEHVVLPGVKTVYLWSRDLKASLEAQKRRGVHEEHYRMLVNDSEEEYSDSKMLAAMAEQRDRWTKNPNVFSICYDDFQRSQVLLERYLDMRFYGFPAWRGRRRS